MKEVARIVVCMLLFALAFSCAKKPGADGVKKAGTDTTKKDTTKKDTTKKDTTKSSNPPGVPSTVHTTFGSGSNSWVIGMHGDQVSWDGGGRVATDPTGNVYVLFNFYGELDLDPSANFVLGGGYYDRPSFAKYSSTGTLLWSKQITNFGQIYVNALKTDGEGNVYCSLTCAAASNIQIDGKTYSFNGANDESILIKFNSSGQLSWLKDIGVPDSFDDVWVNDLTIDSKENVYVAGSHAGAITFYGTINHTLDSASGGVVYYFWAKYNANGSFVSGKDIIPAQTNQYYTTNYLPFGDSPAHIAVDENENVFICGLTGRFTATVPELIGGSLVTGGEFIAKYDNTGTWIWLKGYDRQSATPLYPEAANIMADNNGYIYIYGNNGTYGVPTGNFLGKINSTTGADVWSQNIATTTSDSQPTMTFDSKGNIMVAGDYAANNLANVYLIGFSPGGAQLYRKNITPNQAGTLSLYDASATNSAFVNLVGLYTGGVAVPNTSGDPINGLTDANTGLFIVHVPEGQ